MAKKKQKTEDTREKKDMIPDMLPVVPNLPQRPRAYPKENSSGGRRRSRHSRRAPVRGNPTTQFSANIIVPQINMDNGRENPPTERRLASGDIIKMTNPLDQAMMDCLDEISNEMNTNQIVQRRSRKRRVRFEVDEIKEHGTRVTPTRTEAEASTSKCPRNSILKESEDMYVCGKRRKIETSISAESMPTTDNKNKRKRQDLRRAHLSDSEDDMNEIQQRYMIKVRRIITRKPEPTASQRVTRHQYTWFQDSMDTKLSTEKPKLKEHSVDAMDTANKQYNWFRDSVGKKLSTEKPRRNEHSFYVKDTTNKHQYNGFHDSVGKKLSTEKPKLKEHSFDVMDTANKHQYNWFHDSVGKKLSTEKPKGKEHSFYVKNAVNRHQYNWFHDSVGKKPSTEKPKGKEHSFYAKGAVNRHQYNWFYDSVGKKLSTEKPDWREDGFFIPEVVKKRNDRNKDPVQLLDKHIRKMNINDDNKPNSSHGNQGYRENIGLKPNQHKPINKQLLKVIAFEMACIKGTRRRNEYNMGFLIYQFQRLSL